MIANRATIIGFRGSWGSGLAELIVVDEAERICSVYCDNAPTVRALRAAFGDSILGRDIFFELDRFGVLESFSPAEEVRA